MRTEMMPPDMAAGPLQASQPAQPSSTPPAKRNFSESSFGLDSFDNDRFVKVIPYCPICGRFAYLIANLQRE